MLTHMTRRTGRFAVEVFRAVRESAASPAHEIGKENFWSHATSSPCTASSGARCRPVSARTACEKRVLAAETPREPSRRWRRRGQKRALVQMFDLHDRAGACVAAGAKRGQEDPGARQIAWRFYEPKRSTTRRDPDGTDRVPF